VPALFQWLDGIEIASPHGPSSFAGGIPMARRLVSVVLFGAFALAGCSSAATSNAPAAAPAYSAQAECEQNHGVWRAALNFCEYPAPDRHPAPDRPRY